MAPRGTCPWDTASSEEGARSVLLRSCSRVSALSPFQGTRAHPDPGSPYLKPRLKQGFLQPAHRQLERAGVGLSDLEHKHCLRMAHLKASKLGSLIPMNPENPLSSYLGHQAHTPSALTSPSSPHQHLYGRKVSPPPYAFKPLPEIPLPRWADQGKGPILTSLSRWTSISSTFEYRREA